MRTLLTRKELLFDFPLVAGQASLSSFGKSITNIAISRVSAKGQKQSFYLMELGGWFTAKPLITAGIRYVDKEKKGLQVCCKPLFEIGAPGEIDSDRLAPIPTPAGRLRRPKR